MYLALHGAFLTPAAKYIPYVKSKHYAKPNPTAKPKSATASKPRQTTHGFGLHLPLIPWAVEDCDIFEKKVLKNTYFNLDF